MEETFFIISRKCYIVYLPFRYNWNEKESNVSAVGPNIPESPWEEADKANIRVTALDRRERYKQ